MCVLTINGAVNLSGLPSFESIRHRNTIILGTRKTLHLKEIPVKFLKTYLRDNGNIYFTVS